MTAHIEAKIEDIANTVIMPGDPNRATFIAKTYLSDYKLVNSVRGILAYTGFYKNKRVTVMASGMGMPSIGIYSYELFKFYNVDNIIRIGTAGAYLKDLNLYDVILVEESYSESNFGKVQDINIPDTLYSSSILNDKIKNTAKSSNIDLKCGKIHSSDVFYNENINIDELVKKGCLAAEMETYALFFVANKLNKNATALVTISNNIVTGEETTSIERERNLNEMIKLVLESI